MLKPLQEAFEGPVPMRQIDGNEGGVYRFGLGTDLRQPGGRTASSPYSIYISEDSRMLERAAAHLPRARCGAIWASAALFLLLLQVVVLRWSLRPLQRVSDELTRVQRGQASRMTERHPRELEPLTESINAFIESERENLDRQRNTLADLAHSLKTPLAVLRSQLDEGATPATCARNWIRS